MFNPTEVHQCLDSLVSLDANISKHAPTYLNSAILTNAFPIGATVNDEINKVIKGSVDKMLYTVINQKKINTLVKSIIADFKLFDGRADFDNKNANTGRFVGLRFKMHANQDLVLTLKRVSFQIDMVAPDLKLYLYSDDTPSEALKVIETPYTANRGVQWFDVLTNNDTNLNLPSLSDDETYYYLGYFETDLPESAQSIKKAMNFTEAPCGTCQGMEQQRTWFKARTLYTEIQPFYVDAQHLNGIELPDMNNAIFVDRNNFGMNIDANIQCDISDFICQNKQLFIEPLALQSAIGLLEVIIHSERDNIELQKAQQGCIYILNGNSDNNFNGLYKTYNKMIDALDIDMSNFNKACMPCSKKPGIVKRYV